MSIEIVILITTSVLIGLIVLFYYNRSRFLERRMTQRRVLGDRRAPETGRRAQDAPNAPVVDDGRFVRRNGPATRRNRYRRKDDRLLENR